jgi:hypothetical protein
MAFHELATNSAKYGVLAHGGVIDIAWQIEGSGDAAIFQLAWSEDTSEPMLIEDVSDRKGFGSRGTEAGDGRNRCRVGQLPLRRRRSQLVAACALGAGPGRDIEAP